METTYNLNEEVERMINKTIFPVLVFALCLWGGAAHAHSLGTGEGLLNSCNSKKEFKKLNCLHYVNGILDGVSFQRGFAIGVLFIASPATFTEYIPMLKHYCLPSGVKMRQVLNIIKTHLLDHPGDLQFTSVSLIRRALNEAFPCTGREPVDYFVMDR